MESDNAQAPDVFVASLDKPAPPRFPCPQCGKETKEHQEGARICSNKECRQIVEG